MVKQEINNGEDGLTPQQRTEAFFGQDYMDLATGLEGKHVVIPGVVEEIKIDIAKGWSIRENDGVYRRGVDGVTVDNIGNGTIWRFPDRRFSRDVVLIGAAEEGERGACIQIRAASRFNRETFEYTSLKNQGEILQYLGLPRNGTARLQFQNDSDVLYLEPFVLDTEIIQQKEVIDSSAADALMRDLPEEG